jgi:predicted alpha/beta-hydrolase family hydrolase
MNERDEQRHEDERPLPAEETYKRRGLARIAEIRKRLQEGAA